MNLNLNFPISEILSEGNSTPKSTFSPNIFSLLSKNKSPSGFQKTLEKINVFPNNPSNSKIIKLNVFKIQSNVMEKRARSSSPKEGPKILPRIEENKIAQKYKNLRIESHETLIKINSLWAKLKDLGTEKSDKEKIDLCLEIFSLVFR